MVRSSVAAVSRALVSRLSRRSILPRLGAGVLAAMAGTSRATDIAAAPATPAAGTPAGRAGYVMVRQYHLKPNADYAELTRRVNAGFVPIIRDVPGFVEYLFVEPGNGTHLAVSVFISQAGADESTARATGWAEENVSDFVELPAFSVVGGPVRLDIVADQVATPTVQRAPPRRFTFARDQVGGLAGVAAACPGPSHRS